MMVSEPAMANPNPPVIELHPGLVLKGQLSMAKDIVLTGKFEGDLQTLGCLTVAAGGVATGSIDAGALVLEPGNLVEARVKVGSQARTKILAESKKAMAGKWSASLRRLKELALGRK